MRYFIVTNFTTVSNTDNATFHATRFARRSKGCGIRIEVWSRDDMKDKKVGSGWVGLNSLKREEERWIQLDGREGVDSGVWKVSDQTNQKHKNATVEWFAHTPLNPLHKESPHGRIKLKFELGIGMLEDCISHAWSVELAPEEEEKFEPREILRMGKDLESYIKTPIEFVQDVLAALKFKKGEMHTTVPRCPQA